MTETTESTVDEAAAGRLATQVLMYAVGEAMTEMGYLGWKLGLYEAMRGRGPSTAGEIAGRAGLHERWVLEWLRSQAFAGLLTAHDGDRFELTPTQAAVVADPASRFFRGAAWMNRERLTKRLPGLLETFRTGVGMPTRDAECDPAIYSGMIEEFQREMLVPAILPAVDRAVEKLAAGGSFVDVGCGRGTALLEVAAAFPAGRVHGWDPWGDALAWGEARAAERGITNVEWHEASVLDLPGDGRFDVVLMADCVHHMPDPVAALRAVRGALAADGALIVVEFRVDAIHDNPMFGALGYAASIRSCLNDGMPEGGGAGLGLLGFDEATGRQLTERAGFRSFRPLPVEHWLNVAYEVRP